MNTEKSSGKSHSAKDAQSPGWVQFDEDDGKNKSTDDQSTEATRNSNISDQEKPPYTGAVIKPETVHLTVDRSLNISKSIENPTSVSASKTHTASVDQSAAVIRPETVHVNLHSATQPSKVGDSRNLQTVNLRETSNGSHVPSTRITVLDNAVIRQGFANGDIIVTLLPINTKWPWITPAQFRPELVPEELMAQGLTLTVEEYVQVMEILTNDVRFNMYNICYKRILVAWIFTAFIVLLGLLFSGVTGLTLFGLGVMWLILNALAIFLCMWVKIKLNHNLERCMAQINRHLLKHKIILGLDDRGKISCHKVNLCFIYFDMADCIKKLQEVIEREEQEGRPVNREETAEERRLRQQFQQRMDIEDHDIIIQGSNTTRLSRKQERAEMVFLRYSHRWAKQYVRKHLDLSVDGAERGSFPPAPPRHCISARCPCQFIEEHLKYKPRGKFSLKNFFTLPNFGFD